MSFQRRLESRGKHVSRIESSRALKEGSSEGPAPSEGRGVWGCPPDIIFSPFLARKGWAAYMGRTGIGRKAFS